MNGSWSAIVPGVTCFDAIFSFFRHVLVLSCSVFRAVARVDEIPIGGVKLFQYPRAGEQCILVRTAEDHYVAYSQKCTHLSCAVIYSRENNRLECPCHQGYFSITDGTVLQGPPTRALPRVVLERQGNDLIAVKMEPEV